MITVSGINVYPIKSCAGTALQSAEADQRGIINDRAWMIVDENNQFLTQRDLPRMALIKPTLTDAGALEISAPQMPIIVVTKPDSAATLKVKVWSDICTAVDQGDGAGEWLSSYLKVKCRLVRMADYHRRQVDQRYAPRKQDQVGFADGFPFLIISEASLEDLNSRMPAALPMNRFRPNIVVSGCESFAEDSWKEIAIGEMRFDVVKPCARCVITTVDQSTGTKGKEPLKTLADFRTVYGKLMFGQNMIHQEPGRINVGDQLTVLN